MPMGLFGGKGFLGTMLYCLASLSLSLCLVDEVFQSICQGPMCLIFFDLNQPSVVLCGQFDRF